MEKKQFEQTLETILALREERRILLAEGGLFQSPEFYYLTSRKARDVPDDILSAARAHVAALPVLDYEKFKRDHPHHPYAKHPERGERGFGDTVPDRFAGVSLGILSYVKTHLDTTLIGQQQGEHDEEKYREIPIVY